MGVRLRVQTQAQPTATPRALVHLSSNVVDGWVGSASQHIAARPAPQSAAPSLCPPGHAHVSRNAVCFGFS
jgi:hypothetical protein